MLARKHQDEAAIRVTVMVRIRVRVRLLRVTKSIVPGTWWLQKARQREYGTADILLHTHLFHLDHPCMKGPEPKLLGSNSIRVKIQGATKPTASGVLGL